MQQASFHLSLPCKSVSRTRDFYVNAIGASEGRQTTQWVDINLFGNQITFTQAGPFEFNYRSYKFEEAVLPSFHFGILVSGSQWESALSRLKAGSLEPSVNAYFLMDKPGAHRSFLIADPNGYMLEFKHFLQADEVFSS